MIRRLCVCTLAALWISLSALGSVAAVEEADAAAAPSEEAELAALMELLAEETEIATKTKMNADFVPGTVTVLHGDDLEALGAETVWDALALVPGVQSVRDENGTPSLVVRGHSAPFNQGNVKILINGTDLSRPEGGVNGSVLYMPVEQIERVEVIRGPGAVLYGDFALQGVVNIITRNDGQLVYVGGDSDRAYTGGGHFAWTGDTTGTGRGPSVALNVTGWSSDEAPFPEPEQAEEERVYSNLAASWGGFGLSIQSIERQVDRALGGDPVYRDSTLGVEARYHRELGPRLATTFRLGYLDTDVAGGFTTFDSHLARVDATLQWDSSERHHWILSADFSPSTIDRAAESPPPPPGAPPGAPAPPPVVAVDADREVLGFTVQDRFSLTEAFELTAGLRYDDHSDVGDRWTPRLAVVWRLSESHILKAQYAEGFRPPNFFELRAGPGGLNEALDFEDSVTSEVSYVYRRPKSVARLTLFETEVRDSLVLDRSIKGGRFYNGVGGSAEGVELEWERRFSSSFQLLANLSTLDAHDNRTPEGRAAQASDWLGNLALHYRPLPWLRLGAHWNHVGDRQSVDEDGYDAVDLTFTMTDLFGSGLGLRGGVADALAEGTRDLARRGTFSSTVVFPGRRAWLQLSWRR